MPYFAHSFGRNDGLIGSYVVRHILRLDNPLFPPLSLVATPRHNEIKEGEGRAKWMVRGGAEHSGDARVLSRGKRPAG